MYIRMKVFIRVRAAISKLAKLVDKAIDLRKK